MQRIHFFYAGLAGFFGLFFLMMAWHTIVNPATHIPTAFWLIISVGPLLIPFRGMLNRNLKSCTWMSYLSLPYFVHGVTEAYVNESLRSCALLETAFSLLLCFGAGFYVYKTDKA